MSDKNNLHLTELAKAVAKDFQNDQSTAIVLSGESSDYKKFKTLLEKKIAYLLDNKFEYLINILYKIDVNEKKLNELFSSKNRDIIPSALAELVIERELQKIKLREKYKTIKDKGKLDE